MSYRQILQRIKGAPWILAAPSFVIPAGVAENCQHLEGKFPEVALLFFESASCMAYTEDDLPQFLASLDMCYHVHLPLDLPWQDGAEAVWDVVRVLVEKAAFLSPRGYVLHPPQDAALLAHFVTLWKGAGLAAADLLLENIDTCDLAVHLPLVADEGLSLCLDLGHMLAYEQDFLVDEVDFAAVRMLHLNAPGEGGRHRPLTQLDEKGVRLLQRMLEGLRPDATVTIEVFEEKGLMESARVLLDLVDGTQELR